MNMLQLVAGKIIGLEWFVRNNVMMMAGGKIKKAQSVHVYCTEMRDTFFLCHVSR